MILQNVDKYRFNEPCFESVRIVLNSIGEPFSPEYIQGISGAAFAIAGGCPSRPTCIISMWPPEFLRFLGYEVIEYPCFDGAGADVTEKLIKAVRDSIDAGRPALAWNAFTYMEWDVVAGYDEEQKQFIGRGTYAGTENYAREPWDRMKTADWAAGAAVIGKKTSDFDAEKTELASLRWAVGHARKIAEPGKSEQGIQFYKEWADAFAAPGRERGLADAYCYGVYSSSRKAAAPYLKAIAPKYKAAESALLKTADYFEKEAEELEKARPYLWWSSPEGVDEDRSRMVAPILHSASEIYEKAIICLEEALEQISD